jgi:UDP-N-acetylglucosamine 4,6-dehydratase/5-epimerase|tara:strand:+ start:102 stop:1094 length:993 start_codon:yes stop_codon:yes gene_type:complete
MKINSLNNKNILITGGTGSFGNKFVELTLKYQKPNKLVIFSRDEMKQWEMAKKFGKDNRVRFFLGDVRDKERLNRALDKIDFVVHAAATKIVPTAEYNPFEAVKTNILGCMNLIDAAIDRNISKVVALSTDKASNPINLYGATKLAADKLFSASNAYSGYHNTKFSVVRYGNVMGSRGSIIPFFHQQSKKNIFTLTDERMTRFMMTLEQAVKLVWKSLDDMKGGEMYVVKAPSMKIIDIIKSFSSKPKIKIIGIRPGEKIHEQMISLEESPYTYEYDEYFKILPQVSDNYKKYKVTKKNLVKKNFFYRSDINKTWMEKTKLQKWIKKNYL